jgi:hypothetical protein
MSPVEEFRALDLRCHTFLHDVPLHDAWVIDLAGGGPGRTMHDVDAIGAPGRAGTLPPVTRALFALRFALGRAFGWDRPRTTALEHSYLHRLTDDDRRRCLLAPGAKRGPFRMLYVFPDESIGEIRNATVHGFLVMALRPRGDGYRLYWGIYVKPVGRLTALYMAVIDPFRRFIVYPAMIRQVQSAWARAYA